MRTDKALAMIIALPSYRMPPHTLSGTEVMELRARGDLNDRTTWGALFDRLQEDGLTLDETAARLTHLADEGVEIQELSEAVAALVGDSPRAVELRNRVLGPLQELREAIPVYVVCGAVRRRLLTIDYEPELNLVGPCVVIGATLIRVWSLVLRGVPA